MKHDHSRVAEYKPNSISLTGGIAMGTGVMIGAGIFALTGQIAELAGPLFPLSFVVGAIVTAFSAYTYIKMSNAYPSAGGIGMILQKAYGPGTVAGGAALLMAFSMIINESLVARTFGTYTLRLFDQGPDSFLVPVLGVGLIIFAFLVNLSGNRSVGWVSLSLAVLKVGGILAFAVTALWAAGFSFASAQPGTATSGFPLSGFVASVAFSILAYKGFTTITNSGAEITDPHRNVGRAIIWSILICVVVYLLVAFAVGSALSIPQIIAARDYSMAEAAGPVFGDFGTYFTVALAIVATASGLLASIFAVSRMLAMLTDMKLIPHSHFGMPGQIQAHTLVYTVVAAGFLTIFFDLSRIASLGVFFYLVMDIVIHWGVMRNLKTEIDASPTIMSVAILLDVIVLAVFSVVKIQSDPAIVVIAAIGIFAVFLFEALYLSRSRRFPAPDHHEH
ncbi:amino acid permease [Rhodobacterales bacterium 52_120_T64]|nr:amino acid permease [Rhodobacterales bacterium 52_120_T64]